VGFCNLRKGPPQTDIGLAALPKVMECLEDKRPRVRLAATGAMAGIARKVKHTKGKFPPAAIRCLIAALRDKDARVAANAIYALSNAGEQAQEAIPAVVTSLKHRDSGVRFSAVRHLRDFGPEAKIAVPALKRALKDEDEYVRIEAAETLAVLGAKKVK